MGKRNNEILKDGLNISKKESSDKSVDIAETLKKQEYYHITNLGFLADFAEGARSNISNGEGQGQGFYMRTNNRRADNHVDFQKAYRYFEKERRFKVGGKDLIVQDEQPFITKQMPPVKLTFNVNPDECEPDWEMCGGTKEMFNFLCEHEEIIRGIPVGECKIDDKDEYILLFDKMTVNKDIKNIVIPYANGSHGIDIGPRTLYTCDAAGLAYIMHYFRDNYPEIYRSFLCSVNSEAVKYVGKEPLIPSKVEILNDECWQEIDAQEYFRTKKIVYKGKKQNREDINDTL